MSYTVKEAPKPPRWEIRCGNCGNTNVQQRAWCCWDVAKQCWVYDDGYGEYYCDACEEDVDIDEVEIKP